jgi:dTDP-4-dehydrorhamnose 3,5-epimerase
MKLSRTKISGVIQIQNSESKDLRGSFRKLFSEDEYRKSELYFPISQVNLSKTLEQGTVRGMHYQLPPFSETKIVTCISGIIMDVVVDLRRGSSTFLQYVTFRLEETVPSSVLVPPGCAHGFQALSPHVEVVYVHSSEYKPEFETGLNVMDPKIKISWPLQIGDMSERDKGFPMLTEDFPGVDL